MKYEELKHVGKKFCEEDIRDNGIYLYTREYWLVGNDVYIHEIHSNKMQYTGQTDTYYHCPASGFIGSDEAMEELHKILSNQ